MSDNKSNQQPNQFKTIIILLLCIFVVLGIVYTKRSSTDEKSLNTPSVTNNANRQVAKPDTTADPTVLPPAPDTVERYVLPDTLLGRDKRKPYEAGYEDGYATGCDDGALGQENATYDETSNFRTPSERQTYSEGYREGYAKGYEDGLHGKQFNI